MSNQTRRWLYSAIIMLGIISLHSSPSFAGFAGHNTKGDFGLQSGSQLPPGWYVIAPMYYRYEADAIKDRNGNEISNPGGSLDVNAYVLGSIWVSELKIFGGNYSFQVYPAVTDNVLENPTIGLNESVSPGLTDLYFQPINLGWHTDRADFTAGIGTYAPTGEYEPGGSSNRGLGMWSFEVFAGTTLYLDDAKSWHFAATAFYETHTDKEDTDIRVGDFLTIEGGVGKSFMDGALSVGAAYYAQWKLSDDDIPSQYGSLEDIGGGKNRVYGIGPEISIPLTSSSKLYGFLNARYLWEFGAESTTEGESLIATLTFPIPSVVLR